VAKPPSLSHVESAALPLPALSAWQGLLTHGGLEPGQQVRVHGANGAVGHLAVQLARHHGARVDVGAELVHLVFDTVGGDLLAGSAASLRPGGRVVSVAEEGPEGTMYFVVEPDRRQLAEIARLADNGTLRVAVDSVFPLTDAVAAFQRSMARGKRGKVVLQVAG
jgi:NADPH:quinone reductase-like Zn-dependent oxidoreductase